MEENQQEGLLRSVTSDQRSFIRFINKTHRKVVLYWIDYQGRAVCYGMIWPSGYRDIDTFVSHPWTFVDAETIDRYLVNQSDVFFPKVPRANQRTHVFITLPVYSLRDCSMRVIRDCLVYDWQAFELDIPRSLQDELSKMLPEDRNRSRDPNAVSHLIVIPNSPNGE